MLGLRRLFKAAEPQTECKKCLTNRKHSCLHPPFVALPIEVKYLVFSLLGVKDRIKCRLVCRDFNECVQNFTRNTFVGIQRGILTLADLRRPNDAFASTEQWGEAVCQRLELNAQQKSLYTKRGWRRPVDDPQCFLCVPGTYASFTNVFENPDCVQNLFKFQFWRNTLRYVNLRIYSPDAMAAFIASAIENGSLEKIKLEFAGPSRENYIPALIDVIIANQTLREFEYHSRTSYVDSTPLNAVILLLEAYVQQDNRNLPLSVAFPIMKTEKYKELVDVILDEFAAFSEYLADPRHPHLLTLHLTNNRHLNIENQSANNRLFIWS